MKIIDLLNKISKGENAPNTIRINGFSFKFNSYTSIDCYYTEESSNKFWLSFMIMDLTDEVEIIEEEKEIKKLSFCDFDITINENASNNDRILMDKINELIDVINDMRDKE